MKAAPHRRTCGERTSGAETQKGASTAASAEDSCSGRTAAEGHGAVSTASTISCEASMLVTLCLSMLNAQPRGVDPYIKDGRNHQATQALHHITDCPYHTIPTLPRRPGPLVANLYTHRRKLLYSKPDLATLISNLAHHTHGTRWMDKSQHALASSGKVLILTLLLLPPTGFLPSSCASQYAISSCIPEAPWPLPHNTSPPPYIIFPHWPATLPAELNLVSSRALHPRAALQRRGREECGR